MKNKVAPPFGTAEFDIMYNEGISKSGDTLDLGVEYNLIDKRGTYFRYGDILLGQGRENAKTYLSENQAFAEEIGKQIMQEAGLRPRVKRAADGPGEAANSFAD